MIPASASRLSPSNSRRTSGSLGSSNEPGSGQSVTVWQLGSSASSAQPSACRPVELKMGQTEAAGWAAQPSVMAPTGMGISELNTGVDGTGLNCSLPSGNTTRSQNVGGGQPGSVGLGTMRTMSGMPSPLASTFGSVIASKSAGQLRSLGSAGGVVGGTSAGPTGSKLGSPVKMSPSSSS